MNANCIICSDVLTTIAEIYSTVCGHLFHHHCLMQWIERSHTCPQCRAKTTEKSIHRIYINPSNNDEKGDDASTLQFKLDNTQFKLKIKERDIVELTEKHEKSQAQNRGLRQEMRTLEDKIRCLESAMFALKDQITYFKTESKDKDKLDDEVKRLRSKISQMESVRLVLSGTKEQVNDMLRHTNDPQQLVLLVSTLKKEVVDAEKKRKQIQNVLKDVQHESNGYRKQLAELTKINMKLQQDIQQHKRCEREIHSLKKKICELNPSTYTERSPRISSTSTSTPNYKNVFTGSDQSFTDKFKVTIESPSVPEKVQTIIDSDSPYLPIRSSTVSNFTDFKQKFPPNKFSIFKPPQPKESSGSSRLSHPEISFDGFGGHSKVHEFPRQVEVLGTKRHHSSSSKTTAKFRKLAPSSSSTVDAFITRK